MKKIIKLVVLEFKILVYNKVKNNLLYIVKSKANNSGFAILDANSGFYRYRNLYLEKTEKVKVIRKLRFNRAPLIKQFLADLGMVVLPHDNGGYLRDSMLIVPQFVDLTTCLSVDIDTTFKMLPHTARADVRKVIKGGFTFSISVDVDWVSKFYHYYHKPSMDMRHGEEAYVMPENDIKALVEKQNAEFINIYKSGECVVSVLGWVEDQKYYFSKVGWLEGDHSHVKTGATAAMYWFTLQRAFALNCKAVVWGGTPAYLENGVFKYKAKWNATFDKNYYGLNYLMLNPDNNTCYQFLKNTSLIALGQQKNLIVLSSKTRNEVGLTGPILNDFAAWYLLRNEKAESYTDDVSELPLTLRYWYERVV